MQENERGAIISIYFHIGLIYSDIVRALSTYHQLVMSESHLKRILRSIGLFRQKQYSDIGDVINFVEQQLTKSGKLHGYRWMAQKCKGNGLKSTQEEIRTILRIPDPEGCHRRKGRRLLRRTYISKGPDYIWHLDSYDKLKQFGFCINGCVDGFSRVIVWLSCSTTSSDPKIVGGYFIEAVMSHGGCPLVMRSDHGTENDIARSFQRFLRRSGNDPRAREMSYLEGPSTANQRNEYFWNFLRRECTDFWICLFRDLETNGHFDGGFLDIGLLQYCFMHLVQV